MNNRTRVQDRNAISFFSKFYLIHINPLRCFCHPRRSYCFKSISLIFLLKKKSFFNNLIAYFLKKIIYCFKSLIIVGMIDCHIAFLFFLGLKTDKQIIWLPLLVGSHYANFLFKNHI